jgi:hypothetical protein
LSLVARLGPLLLLAGSLFASGMLAEAFFTLCLRHPALVRHLPGAAASHVRRLYLEHDRNVIQAMAELARFDPELFYTLRPGAFRFANREFDDAFRVNRLGLRDDDASLEAPAVVVLGDSYAMGWGVPQQDTFAQILERRTGLRTLNAGISSYGTVREMRLLDRIDTSGLTTLVIQYGADDTLENRPFFASPAGEFKVGDEARYQAAVARAAARTRYWPGRRTFEFLRDVLGPDAEPAPPPATPEAQARYFVHAVRRAGRTDLSGVQLIAFEIPAARTGESRFAEALRSEIAKPRHPPHVREMRVLDLSGRLGPEHYYDLDDHLRPSGARAVAEAVLEALASRPQPP